MDNDLEDVADAVRNVRELLLKHGDKRIAERLFGLESQLRKGNEKGLILAVSESTGGMGSLQDRFLCPENGDKITPNEVDAVNQRLTLMVKEVELTARSAATKRGVMLVR